ncbi:MAG: GtrA family protein, partial [Clostridia bacterium]
MNQTITKIKKLLQKYSTIINYLIFGVLTTLVNYVVYFISAKLFNVDVIISTTIAWIAAVLFAYITNKKYVFESDATSKKDISKEFFSFITCRLVSGFIDVAIMYVTVNVLGFNDLIMKLASNVVIIIVNYVFSKVFV